MGAIGTEVDKDSLMEPLTRQRVAMSMSAVVGFCGGDDGVLDVIQVVSFSSRCLPWGLSYCLLSNAREQRLPASHRPAFKSLIKRGCNTENGDSEREAP